MADLSLYKVDLDTPQPNGRQGESPRSAFTKHNDLIDALLGGMVDIVSNTAPDPAPYMAWADTSSGLLKRRNAANTAWEVEGALFLNPGTDHAGPEPANPVPYMAWADTSSGLLKRRNAANTAWVVEGQLFVPGILVLPTTPTSRLSDVIYVIDRQQILLWQTIGTFTGYASSEVGKFVWGTSISPRPSEENLIGQTIDRSLPKYAALIAWAEVNGHMVASGSWVKGAFHFASLGGNTVRLPDLRDMFIRATGTDLDTANARALGSKQGDSYKSHRHNYTSPHGAAVQGIAVSPVEARNHNLNPANSTLTLSSGGTETRGVNTALHPRILL